MSRIVALVLLILMAMPALGADMAAFSRSRCFACPGRQGSGDPTMSRKLGVRTLGSAEVQKQSDAQLSAILADGSNRMPACAGKIPEADLGAPVTHLRTFAR